MDEAAVLADIYAPMRRFAAVVGGPDIEPDDLLHDALLKVMSSRRLDELTYPSAYVRTAILSVAATQRRRHRVLRGILLILRPEEGSRDEYPSEAEALWSLSTDDRALLELTLAEGYTLSEAAQELHISHDAARTRSSRALRVLRSARSALEQHNETEERKSHEC